MVRITSEPIDPAKVYELISANGAGSVLFHFAVVKPQKGSSGGTTTYIDYGTQGDAEAEMQTIADELAASYSLVDTLLIRRTGRLGLGEIISLAAVSSPNSADAFEACKLGISRLRKMQTIVKNEVCG
jgi:molybdopterin synthase catalytic subunit